VNCEVSYISSCVAEAFVQLSCGAASLGDCFVTFRHSFDASLSKVDMFMENEAEVYIR